MLEYSDDKQIGTRRGTYSYTGLVVESLQVHVRRRVHQPAVCAEILQSTLYYSSLKVSKKLIRQDCGHPYWKYARRKSRGSIYST